MTIEELARQVRHVRNLQGKYFQTKDATTLNECRDAERRLDRVVKDILEPATPGLYDYEAEPDAT